MSIIKPSFSSEASYTTLAAGYANSNNDTGYYVEGNVKLYAFTAGLEIKKISKTNAIYNVFSGLFIPVSKRKYGAINPSIGIGNEGFIARVEYLNSFTPNGNWGFQTGYTHYFKESDFSGVHAGISRYF